MRILVATDGSPAGIAAVKFGAKLARADGQLIVVTVEPNGVETASRRGSDAQKVLESAARHLRNRPRHADSTSFARVAPTRCPR